jgi:hypothetical protein
MVPTSPFHSKACFQYMQLQVFLYVQSVSFPKVLIQHELLQAQHGISQFQLHNQSKVSNTLNNWMHMMSGNDLKYGADYVKGD